MTQLQQEINRARTLQESLDSLTRSYENLSDGVGGMVLMTDSEKQPALDSLITSLT